MRRGDRGAGSAALALATMLLLVASPLWAGTTGKIVGTVTNAGDGEPVVGANVVVQGTGRGAATDLDGYFYILNLPPGTYTVRISAVGFQPVQVEQLRVSIDQTTTLDQELSPQVLEAAPAVTVVAKRPLVRRDLTSTEAKVGAAELELMPVENVGDVVNLQAGVVNGHVRGGRANEVLFMVDGVAVSDPFQSADPFGRTNSNQVENSAIAEVQVISGTFNAEYGQAMSGIVNVVTKDGKREGYSGEVSTRFGDHLSGRSMYVGYYDDEPGDLSYLDGFSPLDVQDYEGFLGGPVPGFGGKLSFFSSARWQTETGQLFGRRIFLPGDSSNFSSSNPDDWHIERSGDNEVVPLAPFEKLSGQLKLTWFLDNGGKLSYNVTGDRMDYRNLDNLAPQNEVENARLFKYNPDGMYKQQRRGMNQIASWNQAISDRTFFQLALSYTNTEYEYHVHEDPNDPAYVHPDRLRDALNFAFYSGGQGMWQQQRQTRKAGLKYDITHQLNQLHEFKGGVDLNQYKLTLEEFQLVWSDAEQELVVNPISAFNHNMYPSLDAESPLGGLPFGEGGHRPLMFAGYLQDKVEYDFMTVNLGLRYDYFHPDGRVPEDLRDPGNDRFDYYDPESGEIVEDLDPIQPINDDGSYNPWRDKYRPAESHSQLSPRIGIAFPLTDRGVVHFSYGHFFQVPPFEFLYFNPEFEVLPGALQSRIGNAELKPEKTVMYEVGLQQEVADGLGLNVTGFYKDVRNLLGMEVRRSYDQKMYARYINRDYGNVRGITLALDRRRIGLFSATLDYTYQVAEGNSSDPEDVFFNNQADPPRETEKRVLPLDWDQTHTVNLSINLGNPGLWGIGIIGSAGSGLPYTPTPFLEEEGEQNSQRRPANYNVDLRAWQSWPLTERFRLTAQLNVYNVFDIENEQTVFTDTGRATYTLQELQAFQVQGFNSLRDYFTHPEFYSAPRMVKVGLSLGF